MISKLSQAAVAFLISQVVAFPAAESSYGADKHSYRAPKRTDSRAPCPALNTLANHGYISRDGRNISRDMLSRGFMDGFGLGSSVIDAAVANAFQVCFLVTGQMCDTLTNLTLVSEAHLFEHDMSLSREDYKMAYANGGHVNNFNFNHTIFQTSLDAVGNSTHMDFAAAEEMHLVRESLAYQQDYPGWFVESREVQIFEIAFIFSIMSDPALADFASEPKVRVDWWKYWFTNESFPTPLGWKKPDPPREVSFITSVSSRIQNAPITSTPSPLPANAQATGASDGPDEDQPPATLFPLASEAPYVAPDFRHLHRREEEENGAAAADPRITPAPAVDVSRIQSVESRLGPTARFPNPYVEKMPVEAFAAKAQYYQIRAKEFDKMLKK